MAQPNGKVQSQHDYQNFNVRILLSYFSVPYLHLWGVSNDLLCSISVLQVLSRLERLDLHGCI